MIELLLLGFGAVLVIGLLLMPFMGVAAIFRGAKDEVDRAKVARDKRDREAAAPTKIPKSRKAKREAARRKALGYDDE